LNINESYFKISSWFGVLACIDCRLMLLTMKSFQLVLFTSTVETIL
jgi:hypothetical protein